MVIVMVMEMVSAKVMMTKMTKVMMVMVMAKVMMTTRTSAHSTRR